MLELGVAAAIGLVAAVVAWPVAHWIGPAGSRRNRVALFVTFVALFTAGNTTLMPHARAWKQGRVVEARRADERDRLARLDRERLNEVGLLAYPLQYHTPKLPGMGDVNWGAFVAVLNDVGYRGPVCIEVEDRAYEGSLQARKAAMLPHLDERQRCLFAAAPWTAGSQSRDTERTQFSP